MSIDRQTIVAAQRDPVVFADALVGQPLWDHQQEVIRSDARIRCICSGRQAGKSRTLAVLALHEAFRVPHRFVLVLSAGDAAAKDLLEECVSLASSPLLAGSILDDQVRELTLSNGSVIRSLPASPKQVRGKSVDLLILDEAAFIDEEIWTASRYTIIARPDSRVVMASTPFGRSDRFFASAYRAGVAGEAGFASFHWPSTVSPLVDQGLLEMWRKTATSREYRTEVLAEWVDDAGAYFTTGELEGATASGLFVDPDVAGGRHAAGGVDWGFAHDANALVLLTASRDLAVQRGIGDELVYVVAWCEEHFGMPYAQFIERVVHVGSRGRYAFVSLVSEQNGVGAMPTEVLARRLGERGGGGVVVGVNTDVRLKENCFGQLKLWAQQGRLVLPAEMPALLRQLAALEFETTESGAMRIAVPERAGHDDLAMSLALAAAGVLDERPVVDELVYFDPFTDEFSAEEPGSVQISPY